jgi:hypothetical protein
MNPKDLVRIDLQLDGMRFSIQECIDSQFDLIKKETEKMIKAKIKSFDFKSEMEKLIESELKEIVGSMVESVISFNEKTGVYSKIKKKISKYFIKELEKKI